MFGEDFDADTINGFDANPTGGQDRLDVSALGINAGNFAARVSIVDLGADTLVTIDSNNTITLLGINGVEQIPLHRPISCSDDLAVRTPRRCLRRR